MKQLKIISLLILVICLSACSFGYDVLIVNNSNEPIEIQYKITESAQFDKPMVKSIEDWNVQKSIKRFWTEEKQWGDLPESEYRRDLAAQIIRIPPKQIVKIEHGSYNPISEEKGDLTKIIELKIISLNGEITYKGKLLLNQFEKDGYTFIKTYKDELKN